MKILLKIYNFKKKFNFNIVDFVIYLLFYATSKFGYGRYSYKLLYLIKKSNSNGMNLLGTMIYSYDVRASNEIFKNISEKKLSFFTNDNNFYKVILSAAYAKDIDRLLQLSKVLQDKYYSKIAYGLYSYAMRDLNWKKVFENLIDDYIVDKRNSNLMKSGISQMMSHIVNLVDIKKYKYIDLNPYYIRKYYKKPVDSGDSLVLISCCYEYLKIFAEDHLKNIRKKHNNYNHFVVNIQKEEDSEQVLEYLENLEKEYSNVSYSILESSFNVALVSTQSRYSECLHIFMDFNSSVIILDADINPSLDYISFEKAVPNNFDAGFLICDAYIPWVLYNAGFSLIRKNKKSLIFLETVDSIYKVLFMESRNRWTSDQMALFLAQEIIQLNIFDTYYFTTYKEVNYNSEKIYRKKIKAKTLNMGKE